MRNSMPFESISINGMNLANRFVRSATWEGLADRKEITDIVTAFAYAEGQAKEAGLMLYRSTPHTDSCSAVGWNRGLLRDHGQEAMQGGEIIVVQAQGPLWTDPISITTPSADTAREQARWRGGETSSGFDVRSHRLGYLPRQQDVRFRT
jgi:hypothetical protein